MYVCTDCNLQATALQASMGIMEKSKIIAEKDKLIKQFISNLVVFTTSRISSSDFFLFLGMAGL